MQKITGYLRLMRPANIVTAAADILAGIVIAAFANTGGQWYSSLPVFLLVLSTIGLYGGGVVLNDVFDAKTDAVERPERPIPSGIVSKTNATVLALVLYAVALVAAAFVHSNVFSLSLFLALLIVILATVYDKWGKHHSLPGPVNMGLCRGCNLLLGMSINPSAVVQFWWIGIFPVIYIGAITMISRDEVYGGRRVTLYLAAFFYLIILTAIGWFAIENKQVSYTAGFLLLFAGMIGIPLVKAIKDPAAQNIRKSVKAGVIAVILMNASWAAAFGAVGWALIILCLLPLSLLFARIFAVT